jgi:tight adherence protein B
MGAVVGLAFAVGILLVIVGFTTPSAAASNSSRRRVSVRPADIGSALLWGLAAAVLVLVVTAVPMAAVLAGLAAAATPSLIRRRKAHQRRAERAAAWPDAVDGLLTAVRAGVPLAEAMCDAARSGPEPLRDGFAQYASTWRRGGTFRQSLRRMQQYFADPASDRVVVSLALAAEAGGSSVGKVLATQGEFLRSDLRMRGEIDARQSWTVSAARVAVAAPWFAVAAVSLRTESAQAYATPVGAAVLAATAVVCIAAYIAMRRIAALPQPARLPELQP